MEMSDAIILASQLALFDAMLTENARVNCGRSLDSEALEWLDSTHHQRRVIIDKLTNAELCPILAPVTYRQRTKGV